MKEFIDKLIERLEEASRTMMPVIPTKEAINIAKQLAEEYKQCIKSSCSNCDVYDNEKHYCPKWCEVIKGSVAEIEENHNNDFCEWTEISVGGITAVKEPHRMKLLNRDHEQQFCPYCGKKIKVAPYTEGE